MTWQGAWCLMTLFGGCHGAIILPQPRHQIEGPQAIGRHFFPFFAARPS